MSVEAHPNLHAIQFSLDIVEALDRAKRGEAAQQPTLLDNEVRDRIVNFVADISTYLDEKMEKSQP